MGIDGITSFSAKPGPGECDLVRNLGPQRDSESKLLRRIRAHQSWYRAEVLGILDWGTTAPPHSRALGSVLPEENGLEGANFLSADAFQAYLDRRKLGWGVEPYRCERYLTSSQSLTFNLFSPLMNDQNWLGRVLAELGVGAKAKPLKINLEFQPNLKRMGHLDKTIADVYIEADNGAVVVETKLADQFSKRHASPRSIDFYHFANSEVPLWVEGSVPFVAGAQEQLARIHALGSLVAGTPVELLLIHHPFDFISASKAKPYRSLLLDPMKFRVVSLDRFLETLDHTSTTEWQRKQVIDLKIRYVDLHLSEVAFQLLESERSSRISRGLLRK